MGFSSSEDKDRSTTGVFSEGPPCSNTGERGRREDTSDGDLAVVEIQTTPVEES
jgi:hypothetical protein